MALVLSCLFFLVDALQVVIAQALRARGDVWLPTFTHLTAYVFVMMPLAWWLAIPMQLGLNGIVVKSHGGADANGFASALRVATNLARSDFRAEIDRNLKRLTAVAAKSEVPEPGQGAAE